MSIAKKVVSSIGARTYAPVGPLGPNGNFPFPDFEPGEVLEGDRESEFVYVLLDITSAVTMNQGDVLVWDNSFSAAPAVAAASAAVPGSGVGTLFLGGHNFDEAGGPYAGNIWSYAFQKGVYGVWAQRFGGSVVNYTGGITAQGDTSFTTAVVGALGALAAAPTHGATIPNVFPAAASLTFTATTTLGSNQLTVVSSGRGLVKGMAVAATNLPAGCYISDIQGDVITVANSLNSAGPAATASGSAQTITAYNGSMWATFASGAFTMNVSGIYGVYPNATLSGTGVGSNAVLTNLAGITGNQIATVSVANASSETTPVLVTAANYVEGFLRLPYVSVQS